MNINNFRNQFEKYELTVAKLRELFELGILLNAFFKHLDSKKSEFVQQDVNVNMYVSSLKLIKYILENKNKEGQNLISLTFKSSVNESFKLKEKEQLNDKLIDIAFLHLYEIIKPILNFSDEDLCYIIFERQLYKDWTIQYKNQPLKIADWLSLFRLHYKIEAISDSEDLTIAHINFILDFAERDSLSKTSRKNIAEEELRNKSMEETKIYHMNYFIYFFLNYIRSNSILITNKNSIISDRECVFIYDFLTFFDCLQNTHIDNSNTTTKSKLLRSLYTNFLKKKKKVNEHFNYDKYNLEMDIFYIYKDLIEILNAYFNPFQFQ